MSIHHRRAGKAALQQMGIRWWDGDNANNFPKAVKFPIKMDAVEGGETERVAHLGALLGFRPSTIQSCLPCLQRLQMFSPEGKRHFI